MQSQGQACYATCISYIYQTCCDPVLCSELSFHFAVNHSSVILYFVSKNSYHFRAVDN